MTLQSSQMGRGGHRDDRRRRLLAEDLTANSGLPAQDLSGASPRNGQPSAHKSENYGDSEFLQTQPGLTDLIPRRLITYLLLLTLGVAAIGGLIAFYLGTPELLRDAHRPALAELGNYGSLGNWLASLLLLTATLLAIVTFTVRRHKVDDYRGRYHVWLWAAACWWLMATDVAASLHSCLQQVMTSLTGTRIAGDGSVWWVIPAVLLVGAIGSRLLVDMWSSRLSSLTLLLAAVAYSTALTAFFHGIVLHSEVHQFLLIQGLLFGGHLLLALSMGLHARYVILDAEGALPKRVAKKKVIKRPAEKKAEKAKADATEKKEEATSVKSDAAEAEDDDADEDSDEVSSDTWVAVDPPHGNAPPVLKRVTPGETSAAPPLSQKITIAAADGSSDSSTDDSKLSKLDRKALKKKLIDERLKRERKAANW